MQDTGFPIQMLSSQARLVFECHLVTLKFFTQAYRPCSPQQTLWIHKTWGFHTGVSLCPRPEGPGPCPFKGWGKVNIGTSARGNECFALLTGGHFSPPRGVGSLWTNPRILKMLQVSSTTQNQEQFAKTWKWVAIVTQSIFKVQGGLQWGLHSPHTLSRAKRAPW